VLIALFTVMISTTQDKWRQQMLQEEEVERLQNEPATQYGSTNDGGESDEAPKGGQKSVPEVAVSTAEAQADIKKYEQNNQALIVALICLLLTVITGGVLHHHMLDCHLGLASGLFYQCESRLLDTLFGQKHHHFLGGANGLGLAMFPLVAASMCCFMCFFAIWLGFSSRPVHRIPTMSVKYSMMAFVTGILAGLVGIGGGLVFSPFMIFAGMNPHVAVATSTFCVIFTSTSTTMQYLMMGRIFVPLAICYGLCNQLSSYWGTIIIHHIQDKYPNKKSYVTGIVFAALVGSAALTALKLHSMAVEHMAGDVALVNHHHHLTSAVH